MCVHVRVCACVRVCVHVCVMQKGERNMRNSVPFDICDQAQIYWEIKDYTQTGTELLSQGNLHMTKLKHLSSAW